MAHHRVQIYYLILLQLPITDPLCTCTSRANPLNGNYNIYTLEEEKLLCFVCG